MSPETVTADSGNFDPQQAAALLDQTTRRAVRKFEPFPPWLAVLRGLGALAIYGAVWLTVRGQHPYHGPTAVDVPVIVGFGVVNLLATMTIAGRANSGLTDRSRQWRTEVAIALTLWAAVFVVLAILIAAGVSDSIAYGIYPAAVPLIAGGLIWTALAARRRNRRRLGIGLAVAVVGTAAAFAGPANSWLVAAIGLCAMMLASAAMTAWRHRAARLNNG
jgi:hypothetical protein